MASCGEICVLLGCLMKADGPELLIWASSCAISQGCPSLHCRPGLRITTISFISKLSLSIYLVAGGGGRISTKTDAHVYLKEW
ncbi:hypothetical protein BU16DRAFT_112388 [Lophium mytilinum]|uniref:Uncharacterized protein n=1 Tax=Lophium mytilinum TaxID=390894 RepID=A0A6A6QL23_9PEZI|nr:hypothetical protein BU16DRAFT_112388 [Lophium mytilinum]